MADKVTKEDIELKVKEIISENIGIDDKKIASSSNLRDDLGLDSFAAIELIYGAEDKFAVSISDDEATKLVTINDIVELVHEKLNT